MDLGLRDKVIMVAAASRGLGFAIARAVALEGARVSIASPTDYITGETLVVDGGAMKTVW